MCENIRYFSDRRSRTSRRTHCWWWKQSTSGTWSAVTSRTGTVETKIKLKSWNCRWFKVKHIWTWQCFAIVHLVVWMTIADGLMERTWNYAHIPNYIWTKCLWLFANLIERLVVWQLHFALRISCWFLSLTSFGQKNLYYAYDTTIIAILCVLTIQLCLAYQYKFI